ncbi:hypothetical protein FF38_10726 [Lucilia cuprina]|uniref:Uncharacterized protein n=1 Tax=Lucilia cuprina TaxID=7375 RepID=A0A0L0BTD8_LUCCU|nr:uncharacterized protein LOC111691017 [Lucilia cuprina]KNC23286.1 hypothetical protein FF38_10726 [Lucilia cuprina]
MNSLKVLGLICLIMTMVMSNPVSVENNYILADLLRKAQLAPSSKESIVVKRRIFEDTTDGELKQIALRSLVGDIEKNMFASALSLNKVLADKDVNIPEIKVKNNSDIIKQAKEETNSEITTTTSTMTTTTESSIIFSTEKNEQSRGAPTHIVIDRIALQPNTGGIALIPIFELKHTRKNENDSKDHEITKITISKTEITSLATALPESSTNSLAINSTTPIFTSTTNKLEPAITPRDIEQLKEAEDELKEKVAEIEAEPIILSARV